MPDRPNSSTLTRQTVAGFLDLLASPTPEPGGGSAAAMAGAMAAALVQMVARTTQGKAGYANVQDEMIQVSKSAQAWQARLTQAVDEDAAAYREVIAALRLPHSDTVQARARNEAIPKALQAAARSLQHIAEGCGAVVGLAALVAAKGNRNTTSDALTGALLAHSGLRSAIQGVLANQQGMRDEESARAQRHALATLEAESSARLAQALAEHVGD